MGGFIQEMHEMTGVAGGKAVVLHRSVIATLQRDFSARFGV